MTLRNQLAPEGNLTRAQSANLSESDARAIADVAVAVRSPDAGAFLLNHIQQYNEDQETLARYLRHAARYIPAGQMDELATFTRQKFADDVDLQLALFKSVQEGTAQRGDTLSTGVHSWGDELAGRLLASVDENAIQWSNTPVE